MKVLSSNNILKLKLIVITARSTLCWSILVITYLTAYLLFTFIHKYISLDVLVETTFHRMVVEERFKENENELYFAYITASYNLVSALEETEAKALRCQSKPGLS